MIRTPRGKHDFFSLPANAVMLPGDRPGFALHERDGEPLCLIGGRGYYNQTWPADECIAEGVTREAAVAALSAEHPRAAQAPFSVGVLHTGLHLDDLKGPRWSLRSFCPRAWTTGRWGTCTCATRTPPSTIRSSCSSGCIQGRDIKETGERGVYCVTLEKGRPTG